ncbi:tRNA preQ1(34) S-adenosylmethionine ribosyltransferase-isomerase QueA [bacterium]|nr:tRNA preQ1(34) S-adenosylmethionine ribosyltransferase-isomerase QueA [bacterium]
MDVSLFDYKLPPELIAQEPPEERAGARMLVVPREGPLELQDRQFRDLPQFLRPGDCVVFNDTRVIPARLLGRRAGGGQAEVLLLREVETDLWEALVRPGAKLRPGSEVEVGDGQLQVRIEDRLEGGRRRVRLLHSGSLEEALDRFGQTPLPPYIKRPQPRSEDRVRYQTIYATHPGAVAAPTAGLHFDEATLESLRQKGVKLVTVTLHVGLGTFQPVTSDTVEGHRMHAEWCEVSPQVAETLAATRASGGRLVAIGTTAVRTLESRADEQGKVQPGAGLTDIFIYPGYRFRAVDVLLTNFHLPRSTLLMLVSALAGRERMLAAYEHAVQERYRFFSYGDCMLITPSDR